MAEITFGEWLRRERKLLRLTQAQLAEQIGCSAIALRKIEAEERRPSSSIIDRLADIFAIVPSDHAAFQRFARGDWQAAPASLLAGVTWHVERATPGSHLPAPLTSFIGRERDVAKVQEYLAEPTTRLVTLIGPPGIGKTRLSLQVATEAQKSFADGVFFVSLASITDLNLVAPVMVRVLGLVQTDQRSALERLKDGINDRSLLIVLDNFEQIVEAAPLLPELMVACPRLKFIVTSRESLHVPGEWLYPVPPLSTPDERHVERLVAETINQFSALHLFTERARAVQPGFVLTPEDIPAVAAICRRLAGLPLAIELIAARIRLMSPQVLLSRLTSDFTLHADGMRGVTPRQKTLHNAIAWSYDMLSRDEQALLARLSVFAGGFTLEVAQAVTQLPDVIAGLASLLDKSLLVRTHDVKGEIRFDLLVMIRDFAFDRLREMNEDAALRDRHVAYFLDVAEQADQAIHGPHQIEWMNLLEKEIDNFRAALEWCVLRQNTQSALRLLGTLGWPWMVQGHVSELRSWFEKVHALPEIGAHAALYARLLNHLGRASWMMSDYRDARLVLEESRVIWLKLGFDGESGLAGALNYLGLVARNSDGDYPMAESLFDQSLELYQRHGDRSGVALTLHNLGIGALDQNEDARALPLFERSWDLFHELGDVWGLSRASQWLGLLCLRQGNYEKARLLFEQHLRIDEALHFRQGIVTALGHLGELSRYQGENDQATQFYEKGLAVAREFGLKGDWGSLYALGVLALHKSDYALARRRFLDYFSLIQPRFEKLSVCECLTGLAAVAAGMSQPERAARLCGAAQAAFATTDYRIPPFDQAEFDRHIHIAREQLSEDQFQACAAEGRAMTLEQAVEYVLSEKAGS